MFKALVAALLVFVVSVLLAAVVVFGQTATTTTVSPGPTASPLLTSEEGVNTLPTGALNTRKMDLIESEKN